MACVAVSFLWIYWVLGDGQCRLIIDQSVINKMNLFIELNMQYFVGYPIWLYLALTLRRSLMLYQCRNLQAQTWQYRVKNNVEWVVLECIFVSFKQPLATGTVNLLYNCSWIDFCLTSSDDFNCFIKSASPIFLLKFQR